MSNAIQNKCGVTIKDGRLEAMIWVDAAHRQDETVASATPFAKVSYLINIERAHH